MYTVLARKYRPQTFGQMTGQEHVVRTLANALKTHQLAHAFLFTGPRGVGKTTAARLVAKAVNCHEGPTPEPCGRCPACVEIAEGRCVDVVEIDAASNNGVDNIRDVVDAVKYRPARDRYKVFVVDEVHMLSQGAFNALLKTLEEPPEHVKFVLATTDVHKVPETIVSRCQRFDFKRLTLEQIVEQLRKVAAAEGMKVSDAGLALVARAAEGGMRDALSLLDQVKAGCGDSPTDADVGVAVGQVDPEAVARIAGGLIRRDGAAVLSELQALHERGHEMKRVAEALCHHLRNVVVARLVPAAPLELTDAEKAGVQAQAGAADPVQITRLFDIVQQATMDLKLTEQPRQALEVALLKGCLLAPGSDVRELISRVEALAAGEAGAGGQAATGARFGSPGCAAGSAPAPAGPAAGRGPGATSPRPYSPATAGEASTPQEKKSGDDPAAATAERWRAAVAEVDRASPLAGPALKQAEVLWMREGEVALQLPAGSSYAMLVERKRPDIEAALGRYFGRATRIVLQVADGGAAQGAGRPSIAVEDQARREARTREVRDAVQTNPQISQATEILGGEIGSVEEI